MSNLSFAGHTVVITGAGGGLGRAYSIFFGSRGANVVVNDFNAENAQKVVDHIVKGASAQALLESATTDALCSCSWRESRREHFVCYRRCSRHQDRD